MLDVEVKMSLPIYKPQSEGGESSDKTIDSPRSGSEATFEEQTTKSERGEESSLAATTDVSLVEDHAAAVAKQLLGECAFGSDDGPGITDEGSSLCPSANMDFEKEAGSDAPFGISSESNDDSISVLSHQYPAEDPSAQYASEAESVDTPRAPVRNVISAPAKVRSVPPPAVGAFAEVPQSPHHQVATPRAEGSSAADQTPPNAAPPSTEPFSWYQPSYNSQYQYPQYQQYPPPSNQQYNNHYQEYPYSQYSQYSQYPHYQQYPPYSPHHPQDPYWSSNGRVQSSHHHKSDHLSYQKIDELHGSLMRLKDEAVASRETLTRLERLEHKVEFIMDYLKHKLIQNDSPDNARDDVSSHLKQRLVKMQEAVSTIEHRVPASHSSEEEIEVKNVKSKDNKIQKK